MRRLKQAKRQKDEAQKFVPPSHEEIMAFFESEVEAGWKVLKSLRCRSSRAAE